MSGEIFIETSDVGALGVTVGEHLYLVFRDTNGDEYVLRSGPEQSFWPFGEMEIEVNVPIADSADVRDGDTPADRSSTPLDFPGLTDDAAWAIMVKYARMIEGANYDYDLLNENSNAFIGALLHAAGGTPTDLLPSGTDSDDFLGFSSWETIVGDVKPPKDGIFYGTGGDDRIAGLQIDEVIRARGGDDVVTGGRGDDYVWAGRGKDTVAGNAGDDRLVGGGGGDVLRGGVGSDSLEGGHSRDRLNGGLGRDTLDGGAGSDVLRGGKGADLFVFAKVAEGETDRVRDFETERDVLQISGASAVEDLTIADGTEDGAIYADVSWQGFHIRLDGVTAVDLTAANFDFV
ncbi:calcium-binding protein [Tropicimonas isoalkanivorans]|uniref:Hemolysin-type calcium-binding repeat-containing protein n=1 Tax=Tropicimonas isoalkanivorans TaxID=441112 RepID=A0A1I1KM99_9RHOB|nr:calcium-binding protein [Tropicimonas isoalkanivorans]SFC61996.1 Hemolysin-type calcium-binding repeat-containing protein [Tropicimonas isoalkanivorans]